MLEYYEGIGLMPEAPRTESKRRLYNDGAVDRLGVIRHARELDFEVHVIRELLNLAGNCRNRPPRWTRWRGGT
jgi:DNA-binding transcriptional MerR regulator